VKKLERIKNSDFVKTTILLAIVVIGVVCFQLALRAILRTGYPLAVVESPSMVPTLNIGDLIVVQGVKASEIEVGPNPKGDILVFYKHPKEVRRTFLFFKAPVLIVHRAINKTYQGGMWIFTTHGDANPPGATESVPETDVVGKVVYQIPLLGHISLFIQSDAGTLVFILLIAALLIIGYLPPFWKESSKPKPTPDQQAPKDSVPPTSNSPSFLLRPSNFSSSENRKTKRIVSAFSRFFLHLFQDNPQLILGDDAHLQQPLSGLTHPQQAVQGDADILQLSPSALLSVQ